MNAISTMQVKALFWNRTKLQENVEKLEGRFTNHTLRVKVDKWILPPFCLCKWKSKWFLESLVWQLLTEIHLKFTICDNWRFCEHFCKPFLCCCVDFSPSEILCFSLVYWYICTIIWNFVIQQQTEYKDNFLSLIIPLLPIHNTWLKKKEKDTINPWPQLYKLRISSYSCNVLCLLSPKRKKNSLLTSLCYHYHHYHHYWLSINTNQLPFKIWSTC